jgi:hypothetical protein
MKRGLRPFSKLTTVTVAGPPDLNAFDAERAQLPVHPCALTKNPAPMAGPGQSAVLSCSEG